MADDPELAKWRAQRMAQMQGGSGKGAPSAQEMEEQRKKQEAEQERRRIMLNQILSPEAREKIANIRLVKPAKAEQVENYVINAARSGQLSEKITEEQLKDLLRTVTEQTQKQTKVTIMRRRNLYDDEDDDDDDDF